MSDNVAEAQTSPSSPKNLPVITVCEAVIADDQPAPPYPPQQNSQLVSSQSQFSEEASQQTVIADQISLIREPEEVSFLFVIFLCLK